MMSQKQQSDSQPLSHNILLQTSIMVLNIVLSFVYIIIETVILVLLVINWALFVLFTSYFLTTTLHRACLATWLKTFSYLKISYFLL